MFFAHMIKKSITIFSLIANVHSYNSKSLLKIKHGLLLIV